MILLTKLLALGILLFAFVLIVLDNFDDRRNAIAYKLYIFVFVFFVIITLGILDNVYSGANLKLNHIVDNAINNGILSILAYDVFNDQIYNGFYKNYNNYQRILTLVILIIGFITSVKLLQLLFVS